MPTIATITDPPQDLCEVAGVHKALADPTRLRIMQRLAVGEGSVSDLMRHVELSQPLVSWHLRRLRTAGLVENARDGRLSRWRLSDAAAHDLLHHLGAPHSALHPPH